jgi:hypothetical protein
VNTHSNSFLVPHILTTLFLICTVVAAAVVTRFGYIAATEGNGPRQCRAHLTASLAFCFWFALAPILWFVYDSSLPIFEFQGTIVSVDVRDSNSRRYSAYLQIHTTSGDEITVHASNSSPFLRPGEIVNVRYRGNTGELIKATFYTQDGKQEGVLQSTRTLSQLGLFLIALFCTWASIRRYRRARESATENVHHRHSESSGPIDLFPPNE